MQRIRWHGGSCLYAVLPRQLITGCDTHQKYAYAFLEFSFLDGLCRPPYYTTPFPETLHASSMHQMFDIPSTEPFVQLEPYRLDST